MNEPFTTKDGSNDLYRYEFIIKEKKLVISVKIKKPKFKKNSKPKISSFLCQQDIDGTLKV